MLEINPNCSIFYPPAEAGSADFILLQEPNGHRDFVERIVQAALKRQQRNTKKWKILYKPGSNFGMYAVADIAPDEVIEHYEERPHYLVTKQHVRQEWSRLKQEWFAQYAWPLTEEVWCMWSDDPAEWKPLNHSCDPNAWLQGLNMVARRPIYRGEEITLDYATFCGEQLQPFVCSCGSRHCRGMVQGADFLEPWVEQYGDHLSDFVRNKRRQMVLQNNGRHSAPVLTTA
jgi:D-alanine-D-alanine ligase